MIIVPQEVEKVMRKKGYEQKVIDYINKLLSKKSNLKNVNDIRIYVDDYIPLRLHKIFRNLGKKGLIVTEAHVFEGYLILICIKKSAKELSLVPDAEPTHQG